MEVPAPVPTPVEPTVPAPVVDEPVVVEETPVAVTEKKKRAVTPARLESLRKANEARSLKKKERDEEQANAVRLAVRQALQDQLNTQSQAPQAPKKKKKKRVVIQEPSSDEESDEEVYVKKRQRDVATRIQARPTQQPQQMYIPPMFTKIFRRH